MTALAKRYRRNSITFNLKVNETEEAQIKKLAALNQKTLSGLITYLAKKYIKDNYKPEYDNYFLNDTEDFNYEESKEI